MRTENATATGASRSNLASSTLPPQRLWTRLPTSPPESPGRLGTPTDNSVGSRYAGCTAFRQDPSQEWPCRDEEATRGSDADENRCNLHNATRRLILGVPMRPGLSGGQACTWGPNRDGGWSTRPTSSRPPFCQPCKLLEYRPVLPQSGPTWSKTYKFGGFRAEVCRIWAEIGECLHDVDHFRPNLAWHQPVFAKCGPMSTKFGLDSTHLDPNLWMELMGA